MSTRWRARRTVGGDSPAIRSEARPRTGTPSARSAGLLFVVVALVVLWYNLTGSSYSLYVLNTAALAAFGALALNLLLGTAGQVSIGNAAFLAAGAFGTVWASRAGVPFPLDIGVAVLLCGVIGFVVGLPALRIRGIYLALATLSAFFVVIFVTRQYQSDIVGAGSFILDPLFSGDIVSVQRRWSWVLVGLLGVLLVLMAWIQSGRSGRAWRMIRDHEGAAPMMGIPVARYKLAAFVISTMIIGLQGGLFGYFTSSVSFESFTLAVAISYIAMVLIGGVDSMAGALIGAAIITELPQVTPDVVTRIVGEGAAPSISASASQVAYGLLVILFVVYSPQGLVGWFHQIRHWPRRALAVFAGNPEPTGLDTTPDVPA